MRSKSGFTIIELLVVIGIIAILAGVVIVALNPARQFAQARNSTRQTNVTAILDAIGQNQADNSGNFVCSGVTTQIPTSTATTMASSTGNFNIGPCIVPTYISRIPVDPQTGVWRSDTDYDTQYTVQQDSTTGRVTVAAPDAELTVTISQTR